MIKIYEYGKISDEEIFSRDENLPNVENIVKDIIDDVKSNGDSALLRYCQKFDGARFTSLEIGKADIDTAISAVGEEFFGILQRAAENIKKFHQKQVRNSFIINDTNGIVVGQKVIPLEKVGIYVPGGTAAYPSSVLMNCIPAKIAGVKEVIMTTPSKNGIVAPEIIAAAAVAGVDRIFAVGGAQAVAALAYGTESIPRVDKIVGPGNVFVAEAKKQVFGIVGIDMVAGPSEILVVADKETNPEYAAADMLSQAEHDKNASAVLVTESKELALAVSAELERQIPLLPRAEIARASIDNNGKIIIVDSIEAAVEISNRIAPEHLELCVDSPFDILDRVKNAGSVFMGRFCPEAVGDYYAGANHTLPTSGTARFSSPLSVDDFVKKTQYTYYTKKALADAASDIETFASHEGLDAHARSVTVRRGEFSK